MRKSGTLTLFLALLSVVCGYMLSKATWLARVGISVFYQEYEFLKVWWKGALMVFVLFLFLYAMQSLVQRHAGKLAARTTHFFCLAAAVVALYLTYDAFRNELSYRMLGERFHIGVYLFWMGWMVISIYLLLAKENASAIRKKVGVDI